MKTYAAIANGEKDYRVALVYSGDGYVTFKPLGDIRKFDTFEEADQVARDCAAGKYGYHSGNYINMR